MQKELLQFWTQHQIIIIEKYVDFKVEFKYKESDNDGIDFVHSYACEVMNLGLL